MQSCAFLSGFCTPRQTLKRWSLSACSAFASLMFPGIAAQTGKVPGPYLALLEDISATALVVVLSVPTFREQRHPESCAKV